MARILVIDDEAVVLAVLRRLLSRDHTVTLAAGGRGAMDLLSSGASFDVILCDLSMPDMDGVDVHQFLMESRPDLARRMVFLTGGVYDERFRAFMDERKPPTLGKPFHAAALTAAIEHIVRDAGR